MPKKVVKKVREMFYALKDILFQFQQCEVVVVYQQLITKWWKHFGPMDYVLAMVTVSVIGYLTMLRNPMRLER